MMSNSYYHTWLIKRFFSEGLFNNYTKLLSYLNDVYFECHHPLDENRIADAKAIRKEYTDILMVKPVSFLEILAALKWRINLEVDDVDIVLIIFNTSGLIRYDDEHYDENSVDEIVTRLLQKKYRYDGKYGYVYVPNKNIKKYDIWRQINIYLCGEDSDINDFNSGV